jgi:small subunit ribosomal protein S25e
LKPIRHANFSASQAPAAGGKKQKKKWSKGKVKDKAQHAVILDKTTSEKLYKDVQSYRLVTIATLVDRMKINGSLARQALADLEEKGIIKPVVTHSKMKVYSTCTHKLKVSRKFPDANKSRSSRRWLLLNESNG